MARQIHHAPPARLFFGVFTGFDRLFDWVRDRLEARFGPLDAEAESPVFPFPETQTYSQTMGSPLRRKFFFLLAPFPQDGLARIKLETLKIEDESRQIEAWPVSRPINIDPGILNDCRIILASTKDFSHRLYRGDGIWEEVTLLYRAGAYQSLPWTYPDFRRPDYHAYFEAQRKKYLDSLRQQNQARS